MPSQRAVGTKRIWNYSKQCCKCPWCDSVISQKIQIAAKKIVHKIDIKQNYTKDNVNAITHYHRDKSGTDIKLCVHSNYDEATKTYTGAK